ncbi:integrator complex subunit 6-B [Coccinella septempunctata]|uniref:integrator complex subunit 6-B n=1 Tax=Coccinella septempunctata TaxID=41139 RepID=UPI001D05C90C|nr:integrator complex subunit 6-B [Coccinella septempunctata]
MTIIVFLIDTSASMFQRTYIGGRNTILDVAKSAVETFVKVRQRNMDSRNDRYMLLTFEEHPNNIKAGWKENLATFMNELKNLQCFSMTTMGTAVKQAFDILNINRMTSGIDTYGQGRCPFFLETAIIVLITDGGKLTNANGVQEDFTLPMHSPIPGSELTREPFRWDQRLFALVLRLSGTPAIDRDTGLVPSDNSPIDAMCEVTGGRSYCITSHRMLNQCIDSLVQKVQNGVVINFEKIGPDPPPPQFDKNEEGKDELKENDWMETIHNPLNISWHNCRKMIYVPKPTPKSFFMGFWPIPESFWPELTTSVLPARSAHPNVRFTCTSQEPLVIENLPFDKYELEPSPLTQYILSRKQPKTCWQVFVANSYKNSDVGHPFGYLKASTNLTCVNLFVMPYNYPVLLPLLDELSKIHRWKPTPEWRTQFQNYLRTLPAYYAAPLRKALTRMGTPMPLAQTLIPENSEALSYTVSNYLKRIKNSAKSEYDKMCNDIIQRQNNVNNHKNSYSVPEKVLVKVTLKKELISHPLLSDKFNAQRDQLLPQGSPISLSIPNLDKERQSMSFKNAFEIPRNRLIYQVIRMRNNFMQPDWISHDLDSAHSLPISQMGNYQEHLKRQTPQLREIESTPVRQHMFGNPFKIDKRMMVDEADIDLVGSPGTNRNNKRPISSTDNNSRASAKRKPGPLPKQFRFRRPSENVSSAPSTPERSPSPWSNIIERDIPSFDEPPLIIENGLDSPLSSPMSSDRSRSPSPPLEVPNHSVPNENHVALRTNPVQYNCSPVMEVNMNSSNSLSYSNSSVSNSNSDDKISQILKEVNSLPSVVLNHNNHEPAVPEQKPVVQSEEEIEDIKAQNFQIRKTLNKLVRRPGKNYSELFNTIRTLKGDADMQVGVVKLIIKESLRFKRQYLVSLLEEHINTLKGIENKQ